MKELLDKVLAAKSSTLIFAGLFLILLLGDWLGL